MAAPDLEQEVLDLHRQDIPPRQIAQLLGVSMIQVRYILGTNGFGSVSPLRFEGDLPPIHQCLVSRTCADYLLYHQQREVLPTSSLGLVAIARLKGYHHFIVCTYLVDYLCLGLKDTVGPRKIERSRYAHFLDTFYQAFPEGYCEVSLAQAQAIILGAIAYAASSGFTPHPEFQQTSPLLGDWSGRPQLKFGYQNQPFYINGPYDDARHILQSLETHVGRGKFKYILGIG